MTTPSLPPQTLAFIGGGNMASAIIGGLIKRGTPAQHILVVEPFEAARLHLQAEFGVQALEEAGPSLNKAGVLIWAVKPQVLNEAVRQAQPFGTDALHLSVVAGIPSDSLANWLGSERVVRAMPNTPALIGLGQTGLFARATVTQSDKQWVEQVLAPTGELLWVANEPLLDAVTALSGSGPAYVFFFLETMIAAGIQMGLSAAQAKQLAIGTFEGAARLAKTSAESPGALRERVTSKGGTTHAALTSMQNAHMGELFQTALQAAQQRAYELGQEFGA